jgi:hypothetical protein
VVLVGIKCQRSSSNKFASGLMREMGTKQTDGFGWNPAAAAAAVVAEQRQ